MPLDADDDKQLYTEFKKMVTSVVKDASKVDIATLQDLLGKALEMTMILQSVDLEDHDLPIGNKSLTDEQISSNLESLKSKRKHSPAPKDAKKEMKRVKKDGEEKAENGIFKARSPALYKAKKNDTEKNDDAKPRSLIQSPTSFNDSYKNFVDQNFKNQPESSTPKPRSNVRKKEVVKTKIGQFKVKPSSLSPKDSSSNESPPKDIPVSPISWKLKPDFKYEVKEQENDCNILILKI